MEYQTQDEQALLHLYGNEVKKMTKLIWDRNYALKPPGFFMKRKLKKLETNMKVYAEMLPNVHPIKYSLGLISHYLGNHYLALDYIEEAIKRSENDGNAPTESFYISAVYISMYNNDLQKSIQLAERLVKAYPSYHAKSTYALLLFLNKQDEEAAKVIEEIQEFVKDDMQVQSIVRLMADVLVDNNPRPTLENMLTSIPH